MLGMLALLGPFFLWNNLDSLSMDSIGLVTLLLLVLCLLLLTIGYGYSFYGIWDVATAPLGLHSAPPNQGRCK